MDIPVRRFHGVFAFCDGLENPSYGISAHDLRVSSGKGSEPKQDERSVRILLRQFKRLTIAAVGSAVLLAGVVMVVTPGPALVVIPTGLAILATEFLWARKLLQRLRETVIPAGSTIAK